MPVYTYRALDEKGVKRSGVLKAEHPAQLRRDLRAKGWAPLRIKPQGRTRLHTDSFLKLLAGGATKQRMLSRKQLQLITHQLAVLLEGGLPLEKALSLLATQEVHPGSKQMLTAIHAQLREGVGFADCLKHFPQDFNLMYRTTVAAGERTGTLDKVLAYLAHYIELQVQTQQRIRIALFYPMVLAGFSLVVTIFLLIFIVPDLAKTFSHSGHALPWLTQAVLAASSMVKHYGVLLLAAVILMVIGIKRRLANPKYRYEWDRRLLRIALVNKVLIDVELAAFINTLAMLLQSGVTLADSMAVSSNIITNSWLKKSIRHATQRVCEGSSLHEAMADISVIPLSLIGLISGGEASGELTRILQLAARQQNQDLQQRSAWFLSILEPCIIMATGLLVLLIVLAMMMPILTLNQLIK
jgi:general secretion pathway protein F